MRLRLGSKALENNICTRRGHEGTASEPALFPPSPRSSSNRLQPAVLLWNWSSQKRGSSVLSRLVHTFMLPAGGGAQKLKLLHYVNNSWTESNEQRARKQHRSVHMEHTRNLSLEKNSIMGIDWRTCYNPHACGQLQKVPKYSLSSLKICLAITQLTELRNPLLHSRSYVLLRIWSPRQAHHTTIAKTHHTRASRLCTRAGEKAKSLIVPLPVHLVFHTIITATRDVMARP